MIKTILIIILSVTFFGVFFFEIWDLKKFIALSEKKPPLGIMSTAVHLRGFMGKIGQNLVHVVVEWPLILR